MAGTSTEDAGQRLDLPLFVRRASQIELLIGSCRRGMERSASLTRPQSSDQRKRLNGEGRRIRVTAEERALNRARVLGALMGCLT